jgi:hypothetical protein
MKLVFKSILVLLFLISNSLASDNPMIVRWNSAEGIKRLENSQLKNDFYQLADFFQPQINPLYCGAATSVIILNAIAKNGGAPSQKDLEVLKPKVFGGGKIEFKSYSQETFFNDKTNKIKDRTIIDLKNITAINENSAENFDPGLTLFELKEILSDVYDLKVKMQYVKNSDSKTINNFRKLVKEIVVDDKKYLIINFHGSVLNLKTGGHISPIVAFDEASDSVLVLDVAGHKNGWYWAKVEDVVRAMNTKDGKKYRGYLIVFK